MVMRSTRRPLFLAILVIVSLFFVFLCGCKASNSASSKLVEKPIPLGTPAPARAPEAPVKMPPPTKADVENAVHRIFGDDLVLERGGAVAFIIGDFNGDNSEDVAVIARPAPGKVTDVNSELSNWTIQDADKYFMPALNQRVVKAPNIPPGKVSDGEEVLAIIHGYGPRGWRNPDARQAYLVKHAAATFVGTAPSVSQKAIRAMHLPVQTDIILQVRNNQRGFLFWTGGAYAWHPERR